METGILAAPVLEGKCWHQSFLDVASRTTIEPTDSRTESS